MCAVRGQRDAGAEVSIRNGGLRLQLVEAGKEPGLRAYVVYYADGASSDSVVRVGSLDKAVPFSTGPATRYSCKSCPECLKQNSLLC